jgi:hypothetical protein
MILIKSKHPMLKGIRADAKRDSLAQSLKQALQALKVFSDEKGRLLTDQKPRRRKPACPRLRTRMIRVYPKL